MTHHRHSGLLAFVVCVFLILSTVNCQDQKATTNEESRTEPKMLRAHLSGGAQPRFADYPLLYSLGIQRHR
uniref:Secreted protein n=1 Tax=Parasteatoda tepidariorum TaxID=114398 RepID=A0A2L2YMQ9_PARTP